MNHLNDHERGVLEKVNSPTNQFGIGLFKDDFNQLLQTISELREDHRDDMREMGDKIDEIASLRAEVKVLRSYVDGRITMGREHGVERYWAMQVKEEADRIRDERGAEGEE